MNQTPLISVALATYNGSRFLREQLDSIYAQTWPNLEVIACDDRSIDDTVIILEEYRKRRGLKYRINDRNIGVTQNFERVIGNCQGEFIALADQDDIWHPAKLEVLFNGIGNASLVYSDASLIDANGHELPGSLIGKSGVIPRNGKSFEFFCCNACVTGCTSLFRRELLDVALPIPRCELYHDWWLAVAASRLSGVIYMDARLTKYRQHAANHTGAITKTGILKRIAANFGAETIKAKNQYYKLLLDRSNIYPTISGRLSLSSEDLLFLTDIRRYAASLLSRRFLFVSFMQAIRYRKILYPAANSFERIVYMLSILIRRIVR